MGLSFGRRLPAMLALACWIVAATGHGAVAGYVNIAPPYVFTGPSVLSTPTIVSTSGPVDRNPFFVNGSPALTSTDMANGYSVTGSLDFAAGTATSVEITYTVTRPVTVDSPAVTISSYLNGEFKISAAELPSTPVLDLFSTRTALAGTSVTASASNLVIPNGGTTLTAENGPVASAVFPAAGAFELVQTVDIRISGLTGSEEIGIQLPTTSTISATAVPEPTGLMLFSVGGAAVAAAVLRRRRG
jgi:hypothetical protein